MTGTIDLTPDGKSLLVRFPYREDLVDEVRLIPGRRWDRETKVWKVPPAQAATLVDAFKPHGFTIAPEVVSLLPEANPSPPAKGGLPFGDPQPIEPVEPAALSVSLLNERVRMALRKSFPEPVWVVGEVHDFDKAKNRKHVFFSLVEKAAGESKPVSQVEVALFASTLERLLPLLQKPEVGLTLRDGVEIRALVRVDLYAGSGRYQVILEDIDPSFTLGKMALTREAVLAELRRDGLLRLNAERLLPLPPLRIAVLASPESDGWNDLVHQLEASGLGFAVTCFAVRVQGEELRRTMLAGLRYFAERRDDYDVVCIVRGGGSRTDLSWFDDREVALAAARHPLKIVCGIGHERDQSVLDVITHSEKTPTAVGALLVDAVREAEDDVARAAQRLSDASRAMLRAHREKVHRHAEGLGRTVTRHVTRCREQLREIGPRAGRASATLLARLRERLAGARRDLGLQTRHLFERRAARLDALGERQRLLDPARVLERGYALVRSGGKVVRSASKLQPGMELDIALRDGHARATTTEVTEDEPRE